MFLECMSIFKDLKSLSFFSNFYQLGYFSGERVHGGPYDTVLEIVPQNHTILNQSLQNQWSIYISLNKNIDMQ